MLNRLDPVELYLINLKLKLLVKVKTFKVLPLTIEVQNMRQSSAGIHLAGTTALMYFYKFPFFVSPDTDFDFLLFLP